MDHKLHTFPLESNGSNSVVRETPENSTSQIASNDAGLAHTSPPAEVRLDHDSQNVPTENPQGFPATRSQKLPPAQTARCEVARSAACDPTGENAVACGAPAQMVCEFCGPMCASCAEETFCFYGEHRFIEANETGATAGTSEGVSESPKPLFEVVYLELQCANCDTLRLALPAAHLPNDGATLGCPICAAHTTWSYLAHGVTQRQLPFYEHFDPESLNRGRIPWDKLATLLDDDE